MVIGEAVLSAFMQALFDKVIAAAIGELKFPQDIAEELQKLSSSLSTIQAHVEDAEARQLKDRAARSWLAKLKDVAYEMDDLLDEYAAKALQSELEGSSRSRHLSKIHQCPNLISLQDGLLSQKLFSLQQLTITNCAELTHLPAEGFRSLTALKSLHIYDCQMLAPSGQHSLLPPMLEDLRITSCSNLINPLLQELNELSSLTHLTITNCANFHSFPVKLPATLQILEIFRCSDLSYLPADLNEASCLTVMTVLKCPLIPCLSEHRLPESLKELYIKECPLITERCQENGGEDWPKIAHVPVIEIDDDYFIPNRSIRRRLS
ncbi:hypothetical protein OsI_20439 [Oryza sativa Indica Group]|uniref:Disease resistance N-terminal domain-containing protein n=1 Tax=Oryza sativa subsp. indica TaxID=39946 RepID=B8AZI6_ORYSI|nr:hypothetical protein OsI_20439 [Oryza sativa Indica Group]